MQDQNIGLVNQSDLAALVNFASSNSSANSFSAYLNVTYGKNKNQRALFIILGLAACLLNLMAIQKVINHLLQNTAEFQTLSNYVCIIMVGLDVFYCYIYLLLANFMGIAFYKYLVLLTFLYFFMFVAFDLRLFHLISRLYMERAAVTDVGIWPDLDAKPAEKENPGLQPEALSSPVRVILHAAELRSKYDDNILHGHHTSISDSAQRDQRCCVSTRPVRVLVRGCGQELHLRSGHLNQVYIFANPYNFIQFSTRPWSILMLVCAYSLQVSLLSAVLPAEASARVWTR